MKRHWRRRLVATLLLAAGHGSSAHAQSLPGDAAEGYMLARDICSICHVVSVGQVSPVPVGIPSFFDVANDKRFTELALRSFLQTSHNRMPNFRLEAEERSNIISYILSLRGQPIPPPQPLHPKLSPAYEPEPEAVGASAPKP